MKTLEQIITYKAQAIDARDINRLIEFVPEARLADMGLTLNEAFVGKHEHKELTRQAVLEQLKQDVAFGFEKALDRRGISSGCMFEVVRMWNWILEDGLENFSEDNYAMYGLPLFKATAVLYGFDNPIGDDNGNESKYGNE